jgi:hypothetical protein
MRPKNGAMHKEPDPVPPDSAPAKCIPRAVPVVVLQNGDPLSPSAQYASYKLTSGARIDCPPFTGAG